MPRATWPAGGHTSSATFCEVTPDYTVNSKTLALYRITSQLSKLQILGLTSKSKNLKILIQQGYNFTKGPNVILNPPAPGPGNE